MPSVRGRRPRRKAANFSTRAAAGSRFRRRRTVRAGGLGVGRTARAVRRVWENALFPPPGVCFFVSARPNCLDSHPRRRRRSAAAFALALLAGAALSGGVMAAVVRTPNVEAELVAERTALTPGRPLTVALRLKMREGWHTYWLNPGDSGLPTTLEWTLPAGLTAGPIVWPAPHALPAGPLVNYGYEGEVFHLVELTPAASLAAGAPVTVSARADWLVCKETCIPEGADLSLTLPVAATSELDPTWGPRIAATRAALPQPLAGWQASARGDGATIALKLAPPPGAKDPGALFFFPFAEARIEPSAPQKLARDGDAFVLTLPVASTLAGDFGRVAGVVTASNGFGGAGACRRAARRDHRPGARRRGRPRAPSPRSPPRRRSTSGRSRRPAATSVC